MLSFRQVRARRALELGFEPGRCESPTLLSCLRLNGCRTLSWSLGPKALEPCHRRGPFLLYAVSTICQGQKVPELPEKVGP